MQKSRFLQSYVQLKVQLQLVYMHIIRLLTGNDKTQEQRKRLYT